MCIKNKTCQTTHKHDSAVCANPSHTHTSSETKITEALCCTHDSGLSADDKDPDPEDSTAPPSNNKQYWKISGMDCPSCAKKIENALNRLEGIVQAKVLFATEKLEVSFNAPASQQSIELTCQSQGFKLSRVDNRGASETQTNLVKEYGQIGSIAVAMLVAAIVNIVSPSISQWLFTLTCILGLIPITKKAIQLAKNGTPFAIETLMSVAAIGALYLGETAEAAMVLLLFLIGEKLEAFAANRARSGVKALIELVPENTTKIQDGQRIDVAVSTLEPGDIIELSPGDRSPADGELIQANASFDESALTGESVPVERQVGESVMAGSVVVDKVVRLTVTSKQGENAIDRILHLIEQAESRKAPLERFLDKFSRWYTPLMMVIALFVIVIPPVFFAQDWNTWIYKGLALLLIACPCALVISTPAAITSGLAAAARRGALIKGGAALEQLGKIQTIAFDKTGTLTQGKPEVTDFTTFGTVSDQEVLQISAAIEMGSRHPLALAVVHKAQELGFDISAADDMQAMAGHGVSGSVNGKRYQLMAPSRIESLESNVVQQVEELESQAKTVTLLTAIKADNTTEILGLLAWQDTLREDAPQAIQALKALGIQSIMLTGDNNKSAQAMSQKVGMDFKAQLLPEDKVRYVEEMTQTRHVAMVGDGINDAPAMKAANVSIAMGGGTDVALETADSALTHNRLTELASMIELSRSTLAIIKQNIFLALGLKAVFLVTTLLGITGL